MPPCRTFAPAPNAVKAALEPFLGLAPDPQGMDSRWIWFLPGVTVTRRQTAATAAGIRVLWDTYLAGGGSSAPRTIHLPNPNSRPLVLCFITFCLFREADCHVQCLLWMCLESWELDYPTFSYRDPRSPIVTPVLTASHPPA